MSLNPKPLLQKFFIVSFIVISTNLFAQTKQKENAKFTIRGSIGIPKPISSKLFKTCFKGVVESNLSCNLKLFDNVFAGLGYQNSFFQNDKDVFVKYQAPKGNQFISYDTRLMLHSAYVKLGYDYFFSNEGFVSYSLNTGISFAQYLKTIPDTSKYNAPFPGNQFSAPYIQPEVCIHFLSEEHLSFSLMFAYNTLFYHFDAKAPRFNQLDFVSQQANHNKYVMSWFSFGFGFAVLLNKKK